MIAHRWLHASAVVLVVVAVTTAAMPRPVDAWIFGLVLRGGIGQSLSRAAVGGVMRASGRGLVRSGFRRLSHGGGGRLISAEARAANQAAHLRRVAMRDGQARMQRLFGNKPYLVRDAGGKVIRSATVEGDTLVFRQGIVRTGYAQWEAEGLVLYRVDGRRVAQLTAQGDRILATDSSGRYLGQFIRDEIGDQIQRYFVDAQGQRHTEMYLPPPSTDDSAPGQERFESYNEDGSLAGWSVLRDGMLFIYDQDGVELGRGVWEGSSLVLYDLMGNRQGAFRREGEDILAFDADDHEVGRIEMNAGRAVYREVPAPENGGV